MNAKLVHERDTKNFAVYSVDPQGLILKDTLYLPAEALKSEFAGKIPEELVLRITRK